MNQIGWDVIFDEYQNIKGKLAKPAHEMKRGMKVDKEPPYISVENLQREKELKQLLTDNITELSSNQLKELYQDDDLAPLAVTTLARRKLMNNNV